MLLYLLQSYAKSRLVILQTAIIMQVTLRNRLHQTE